MDDYKTGEDRKSLLLEGMYNGVAGKIDEVRQTVQREIQYNSAQQVGAYESLTEEFRAGVDSLLAELRYVAQQSSAIYDYNRHEQDAMRDSILEEFRARANEMFDKLAEHVDKRLAGFAAGEPIVTEAVVDYDVLAEKVAARLLEAERAEAERRAQEEEERRAQEEAERAEAERLAREEEEARLAKEEEERAEAERLAREEEEARLAQEKEERAEAEQLAMELPAEEPAEAVAEAQEEPAEQAQEEPAPAARAVPSGFDDGSFDYDLLAEKIAIAMPEVDYDLIADKVAAVVPQPDDILLADRIAAALPQVDETAIADRVAENIPLTDYDLIAERVVAAIAQDAEIRISEESIEKIARRVAELLRGDEGDLERIARDTLAEEPVRAEREEIAAATAAVPAPIVLPEPPEGMMTRYKRSFIAKIIGSEDDVKEYYSELKNALLAYQKAASQVSWYNDRFTLKGETVAKIGIRGRTLCLYLALDPAEFPSSVYHQKFAGDTKMYEKTPMMVKIKSGVALKRAVRLIELLMEKNGAVGERGTRVDYAAQYAFRSDEELLAEGLIKTAIVEKSDLDF